jgi:hypothetical protein
VVLFVVLAQIKDTFVKNVIILAVAPEKNKQKKMNIKSAVAH